MPEPPAVWDEQFRTRAYEVDAGGHASPLTVCDWLQEAAGNHATALGWSVESLAPLGLTWVLSRLHLEITRLPAWREVVSVKTWPAGTHRLYALREFAITDAAGGAVARATSAWLLIDLGSRRPSRPPGEISEIASRCPGRTIEDGFGRLPEPGGVDGEPQASFQVRWSDLDMNGHANNVRVIGWVLETAGAGLLSRRSLAALEIDFRGESRAGEAIHGWADSDGGDGLVHRLARAEDGREVARAVTRWAPARSGTAGARTRLPQG